MAVIGIEYEPTKAETVGERNTMTWWIGSSNKVLSGLENLFRAENDDNIKSYRPHILWIKCPLT